MKSILLIVTARDCGACTQFKSKVLPELKKKILSENVVNLVHDDLPTYRSSNINSVDPDIPASVGNYIRWFPTLLLFPVGSWEPVVFNGIVSNGTVKMVEDRNQTIPMSLAGINGWIHHQLVSNPQFQPRKALIPSTSSSTRFVLTDGGKPVYAKTYYQKFDRRQL
jgi:hypothetical protein